MKAFLIGNGASIPYGSPPGVCFFSKALDLMIETPDNNSRYKLKEYLSRAIQTLLDLNNLSGNINQDILPPKSYSDCLDKLLNPDTTPIELSFAYNSLSKLLSCFKIWEQLPFIVECYNDNKVYKYDTLERKRLNLLEANGCLFDELSEFSFNIMYHALHSSSVQCHSYSNFAKYISGLKDDILIINLNYDDLLDSAVQLYFDGNISYVFAHNYEVHPSACIKSTSGHKLFLIKPHGSFNHLYCSKCNSFSISNDIPLQYSQDLFNKKACLNPKCKERNLPHYYIPYASIDVPIKNKDILFSILSKLESILNGIDKITTIGYSFSIINHKLIDNHLVFIFKSMKEVTIVSRDPAESNDISLRLRQIGINSINTDYYGFDDYINKSN